MTIERIFLVLAVVFGFVAGNILVMVPSSRDFGVPPFYWVLIATFVFEAIAFGLRGGGGPPITMQTRVIGFAIALALTIGVPWVSGVKVRLL